MKIKFCTSICILVVFLLGCSTLPGQPKTNPPQQSFSLETGLPEADATNKNLPDITGGPESKTRTGEHTAHVPNIVFFHGPSNKKLAALTFDDGPDVHYTTRILDILKKDNIKATFFIVGSRAEAHPEMVKRIHEEGHAIGNHTWDHPDLKKIPMTEIKSEVDRTEQLLTSLIGYKPHLFRPPYGLANANDVKELGSLGYKVIDWSVDTRDWAGTPPDKIMEYVHKEATRGAIVLEHCAGGRDEKLDNTLEALPRIIAYFKEQGYSFVTIPELLNIPK